MHSPEAIQTCFFFLFVLKFATLKLAWMELSNSYSQKLAVKLSSHTSLSNCFLDFACTFVATSGLILFI